MTRSKTRNARNSNRLKTSSRPSSKRRRRSRPHKRGLLQLAPGLIVETLAVLLILGLYFGMHADLQQQKIMKLQEEVVWQEATEVGADERPFVGPILSAARTQWNDWRQNFEM